MAEIKSSLLFLAIILSTALCQQLPVGYNVRSKAAEDPGMCPETQNLRENMKRDIRSLINRSVIPALMTRNQSQTSPGNYNPGYGACGCGGPGWRRAAYLNMSDPTQTCPPAWELIATPRRSCARPSSAGSRTCFSATFPITQGTQYTRVCGRLIGYQIGEPGAFYLENTGGSPTINEPYVAGVSLTYGNPRQHIWTFAVEIDETRTASNHYCPCTQSGIRVPSYVGNDYFCETGVPPGQSWSSRTFYADDPLWDGQGCGSASTCCTFNDPPWFCKQLPQSTSADLEVRLCNVDSSSVENTPIQLIEIYIQ